MLRNIVLHYNCYTYYMIYYLKQTKYCMRQSNNLKGLHYWTVLMQCMLLLCIVKGIPLIQIIKGEPT